MKKVTRSVSFLKIKSGHYNHILKNKLIYLYTSFQHYRIYELTRVDIDVHPIHHVVGEIRPSKKQNAGFLVEYKK